MAYDDNDDVIGYAVGILNLIPGTERIHLLRIYAKKKEVMDGFINVCKELGKQYKIKILSMTAVNHIKAYQKKYGFKVVSVNMERRIL